MSEFARLPICILVSCARLFSAGGLAHGAACGRAGSWGGGHGLHNLCAIPIFAGIPVAGLASALAAARRKDYGWACYSAVSSLSMAGNFLLFGAAFGERVPRLLRKGGIFQRMSIAAGFGWLSALSLRCLSSAPRL